MVTVTACVGRLVLWLVTRIQAERSVDWVTLCGCTGCVSVSVSVSV